MPEKTQHTAEGTKIDFEKLGSLLTVFVSIKSYHSESHEARFSGLCGPSSLLSKVGVGVANQLVQSGNQTARLVLLNGIPETRQSKKRNSTT